MPQVVKGLNEAPSKALLGKAPEDVAGNENAVFDLQKANAAKAEETEQKHKDHKQKLFASGTVRQLLDNKGTEPHAIGPKRRSFLPSYSGQK